MTLSNVFFIHALPPDLRRSYSHLAGLTKTSSTRAAKRGISFRWEVQNGAGASTVMTSPEVGWRKLSDSACKNRRDAGRP